MTALNYLVVASTLLACGTCKIGETEIAWTIWSFQTMLRALGGHSTSRNSLRATTLHIGGTSNLGVVAVLRKHKPNLAHMRHATKAARSACATLFDIGDDAPQNSALGSANPCCAGTLAEYGALSCCTQACVFT